MEGKVEQLAEAVFKKLKLDKDRRGNRPPKPNPFQKPKGVTKNPKRKPKQKPKTKQPKKAPKGKVVMLQASQAASTSRVASLMRMLADPEDAAIIRPGQMAAFTTAIKRVKTNAPVSFTAAKQAIFFLFRDPFRSAVVYWTPQVAGTFRYTASGKIAFGEAANAANTTSLVPDITKLNVEQNPDISVYIKNGGTETPHGDNLFPVQVQGSRKMFVFKGPGETILIGHNQSGAGTFVYNFYTLIDGAEQFFRSSGNITVSTNFSTITTADPIGYYAVTVTCSAAPSSASFTLNVDQAISGPTWAHLHADGLAGELMKIGDLRGLAKSVRISNATPDLYRQGHVVAVQTSGSLSWIDFAVKSDPFKFVASMNGALQPSDVRNGLFTYLKPTSADDFEFRKNVDNNVLANNRAGAIVEDDDCCMVVVIRVADTTNQIFNALVTDVYEYRTNSQQEEVAFSEMTEVENLTSFDNLRAVPQFAENPLHIRQIWDKIKQITSQGMNLIRTYGPTVLKVGEFLSSL